MTQDTYTDLDIAVRAHKHDSSHLEDDTRTLKEQCKAANEKIIAMVKDYRYYSAQREINRINRIISEA